MNIRKLLHQPTNKQEALISADIETILGRCDSIANDEWHELQENQKSHDGQCPKCQKRKIVDKISLVQGSGNLDSSMRLFGGHVKGSMNIDTHEVNHCSDCGNEWKKARVKYINKTDILRVALIYLGQIMENPDEKRHNWKVEAITVFDKCYAETINRLVNKHKNYISSSLSMRELRKHYASVFD